MLKELQQARRELEETGKRLHQARMECDVLGKVAEVLKEELRRTIREEFRAGKGCYGYQRLRVYAWSRLSRGYFG